MTAPKLYVFAISHYCEKARWALDWLGVPYQLQPIMPGLHRKKAKQLGAVSGSVPFLETDTGIIAGSGAIIDWAEARRGSGKASLDPADQALEARLDAVTGVHIRRYYYSDALLNDPQSVRPIFSRDLALLPRLALTLGWSKIVPKMIQGMDLGPEQGRQSREILLGELDWLDSLLADGRPYLTSERFTRADLTAASLLAPLVNPAKHPTYGNLSMPTALAATIKEWQERPVLRWVNKLYAAHR